MVIIMLQEDLRAELIKQFPSEAIEEVDSAGKVYFACPTCKRALVLNQDKCSGCGQTLGWNNVQKKARAAGIKTARVEFEVPLDFTNGDCRKCPLSYIAKVGESNAYECPLKMRAHCNLEFI